MATTLRDLHAVYGPIVRTAPNELSFIEPTAWKTIYGQRREGHAVFRKNYDGFHQNQSDLSHSVFIAGDEDHLRMRKVLNHAFSEKALREQEPLIQSHVDMLIKRLQEQGASNSNPVDLIKWYNWTAFDIVADLAFGEPLNCLTDSRYHHWVELLSEAWKVFSFVSALKSISPSNTFTRFLVPTSLIQKQLNHFNIILERVRKRIATGSERKDFITAISSNNTKNGMTSTEILSNASLLVAAGTETVATLLPAVTYLLAKNPETLSKAVSEIRGTCLKDEDLSIQDVKRLPYLAAAIDEALRLFPPVPEGLPRVTPSEGQHISGQFIPGGVSLCQFDSSFLENDPLLRRNRHLFRSVLLQRMFLLPTSMSLSGFCRSVGWMSTVALHQIEKMFSSPSRWVREIVWDKSEFPQNVIAAIP